MSAPASVPFPRRKPVPSAAWYGHNTPSSTFPSELDAGPVSPVHLHAASPTGHHHHSGQAREAFSDKSYQKQTVPQHQGQPPPPPSQQQPQQQLQQQQQQHLQQRRQSFQYAEAPSQYPHRPQPSYNNPAHQNFQPAVSPPTSRTDADASALAASTKTPCTIVTSCGQPPPHPQRSAPLSSSATGPPAPDPYSGRDMSGSYAHPGPPVSFVWNDQFSNFSSFSPASQIPHPPAAAAAAANPFPTSPTNAQPDSFNPEMNATAYLPRQPSFHPRPQSRVYSQSQAPARRSFSNATTSSSSSGVAVIPISPVEGTIGLKRDTSNSSRSTVDSVLASPNSYVTLLRKQKATVWCDRAQNTDPGLIAKQRAARERVAREMVGPRFDRNAFMAYAASHSYGSSARGSSERSISTVVGSGRQKIKPHAAPPIPADISGSKIAAISVPQRLSASEAYDDDEVKSSTIDTARRVPSFVSGRENSMGTRGVHSRSGSGRSNNSVGSAAGDRSSHLSGARLSFISARHVPSSADGGPSDKRRSMLSDNPSSNRVRSRTTSMTESRDRALSAATAKGTDLDRTPTWSNYLSPPSSVRSSPAPQRVVSSSAVGQAQHRTSTGASSGNSVESSTHELKPQMPVPELAYFSPEGDGLESYRSLTIHNPDSSPPGSEDPVSGSPSLYSASWLGNESSTTLVPHHSSDYPQFQNDEDGRNMTMTGSIRLYVANPDLSD